MASELTAWMQMLPLDGPARTWEPKRLRLRLLSAAGRLVHGGRRLRLRLAAAPDPRARHRPASRSRSLDQLGGIWEIASHVTLPKALPSDMKESF